MIGRALTAVLAIGACAAIFAPAQALAQSCAVLGPADLQSAAGLHVTAVPFMSKPGAGGKCANFAGPTGKLVLGVTRLASAADYTSAVSAVPTSIYPTRIKVAGVGDEAVLMEGMGGSLRYFIARKGGHGVILFPFGKTLTDDQLKKLAVIALSR
jgi:hypothetical protein